MATYHISGNTFANRAAIRASGASWNESAKRWELDVIEHGMKRTDGEVYRLRKLAGLRVDRVEASR